MNSKLRTKNFDLLDGTKLGVEKQLSNVVEMFHPDTLFDILFVKRDKDYKCEIKVQRGRDFIRSEETGKTVEFALDNAVSTLKKRVRKIKSMHITKKRGNSTISSQVSDCSEIEQLNNEDLIDFNIDKRKFANLSVISEEEAILDLESLNHSFYIFKNKDIDNKVCVIYRRNAGYGLIETN